MFDFNDLKFLQYLKPIFIGIVIYMFIMTIIIFLLLFNILDIHTIVQAMQKCTTGFTHLLGA